MTVSTLTYNASTGSNTAASGAGPGTAVTGTSAAHTGGVGSTTITLTNTPDLSGVAANDILWLNTSAGGRHLSRITAVDDGADTVTVEDSFNIAGASAVDYAIGGKRLNWWADSTNTDIDDMKAGWDFELEDTAAYAIPTSTAPFDFPVQGSGAAGAARIIAASGASPSITMPNEGVHIFEMGKNSCTVEFIGLTITHTTSTSLGARIFEDDATSYGVYRIKDCTLHSSGVCIEMNNGAYRVQGCDIQSDLSHSIECAGRCNAYIGNNIIHDTGDGTSDHGIKINTSSLTSVVVVSNVIRDGAGAGINIDNNINSVNYVIHNNVIEGNTGDGIDITGTINVGFGNLSMRNNILSNNVYGISSANDNTAMMGIDEGNNAFYNNSSGLSTNITRETTDVTLTADPYTNAAGDDYTLNATAGGGAACKDAGYGYNG